MSSVDRVTARVSVLVVLVGLLSGCAAVPAPHCAIGEQAAIADTFYFGTRTPTGVVSRDEWADFLATVVTPRFPQGLTVHDASGQWRRADGTLVREASYVLLVIHPANGPDDTLGNEIVDAYRQRFRQDSVLRVKTGACASF